MQFNESETYKQCALHFNEKVTRTHFLFIYASSSSSYFIVEKATKTLHQMSPCTPASISAKITGMGIPLSSYNQKESLSCVEVTKLLGKYC